MSKSGIQPLTALRTVVRRLIPTPLFWTALLSYAAAVGLALSLNPQFIPTDANGGPVRLGLVFLLGLANYAESRIALKHPRSGKRTESFAWAVRASMAAVVLALVPYGLDELQKLVDEGDVSSQTAPALAAFVAILGFWGYCTVGRVWLRSDVPKAPRPGRSATKRSTTRILTT